MVRFTPYEISLCLYDKERTKRFAKAIEKTVSKGDIVIDAGSGTGILGLLAAKAGAKKVYCIEIHPRFAEIIKKNAEINKLQDKIIVIKGDASRVKIPQKADVLLCELLSTGLFFEPETKVINHLKKYLKKDAKIIPEKCVSWVQLVDAQKDLYGLHLNYDSRSERLRDKGLTTKTQFDELNFQEKDEPLCINSKIVVEGKTNGSANAIRVTSRAKLRDSVYTKQSRFLFNPTIVYLKKKIKILKGKSYLVHISYKHGGDTLGTKVTVKRC